MRLTRLSLIICIGLFVAYSVHAETYYPNIGVLRYGGDGYAESYFAWMNPGWSVSNPGYEKDFVISPFTFSSCTSYTNLWGGFDDCPTAWIDNPLKKWAFTFGTFHAEKIQRKRWYWGAWDFNFGPWPFTTREFFLQGQEDYHRCPWDSKWCMYGTGRRKFLISSKLNWLKAFDQWWYYEDTSNHLPPPYNSRPYNIPHPQYDLNGSPQTPPLANINLFVISKSQTGTNSTEVHVLDGTRKFRRWLLHTGTPLHETGDTFDFTMGDYNRDGYQDLVILSKKWTGTGTTEVHILSGANKFQSWLLKTSTPLHETGDTFDFTMGDYNRDGYQDLIVISKKWTGTGTTEVHVLDGRNKFQRWLLQTGTPLHETGDTFDFTMGDYNKDGYQDLVVISKRWTGTGKTEVHVLDGRNKFQRWLLQTGTPLHETGHNFDFVMGDYNRDGTPDVVVIKKNDAGTRSTEVHVLSGASKFQHWLLHTGTPLHQTGNTFDFGM